MGDVKRIKLSENETDDDENVNDFSSENESEDYENVIDFCIKSDTTDYALIVEEKKLNVSRLILGLTSPVFKKMLKSDFKEKNQNEIYLPNKKYQDVLEFLKCVYPGSMKPVTMDTVFDVLPLADEYLVHNLKKQCQQVLLANTCKTSSTDDFCKFISVASQFGLKDLLKKCVKLAGDEKTSAEDLCTFILVAVKCELVKFQEKCVKLAGNLTGFVFSTEADKFNLPIAIQAAIYKDICIKQSQVLGDVKFYSSSVRFSEGYYDQKLRKELRSIDDQKTNITF